MPEIPRPKYDTDANKLRKAYEKALKDVQKEIKAAIKKPDDLAFLKAREGNIRTILSDIQEYGEKWAERSLTKASREGIANSLVWLGHASSYEEALKIATFSETNRKLTDRAIADTQKDLLAVTTNMQRQSITAVRKAASKSFAESLAKGNNSIGDLSRAMERELTKYADLAIVDRVGRRWKVGTYTHMIAQTKMMEAHKASTMQSALDEGSLYGRISRHGATDACRGWEGRIVKLDVNAPGEFPFYDDLPRREIFHPNCRHIITPVRNLNRLPDDIKELNGIKDTVAVSNEGNRTTAPYDLNDIGKIAEGDKLLPSLYLNKLDDAAEDYIGNQANKALKSQYKGVKTALLDSRYAWVDDSNSAYSRAIENHFAELYELPYRKETTFELPDVSKAALDFTHDDTVNRLKAKGYTHVKVYRGVSWSDEDNWLPTNTKDMTMTGRALTSWTTKRGVAEEYADYVDDDFWGLSHTKAGVIEAIVPVDNVAFSAIIGDTDELVLIGDIKGARLVQVKEANKPWKKPK